MIRIDIRAQVCHLLLELGVHVGQPPLHDLPVFGRPLYVGPFLADPAGAFHGGRGSADRAHAHAPAPAQHRAKNGCAEGDERGEFLLAGLGFLALDPILGPAQLVLERPELWFILCLQLAGFDIPALAQGLGHTHPEIAFGFARDGCHFQFGAVQNLKRNALVGAGRGPLAPLGGVLRVRRAGRQLRECRARRRGRIHFRPQVPVLFRFLPENGSPVVG